MAITFSYEGVDYCLEVTPKTIKTMEKRGVDFTQLEHTVDAGNIMWNGLFIAHHDTVRESKRQELRNLLSPNAEGDELEYDEDGKPVDSLGQYVLNMYLEALKGFQRQPGNVSWART